MIYLDCAATSLQKPDRVSAEVFRAIRTKSSPGRGSYGPAMAAADCLMNCREKLASFFNADDPEKIIFTTSATHGLNIAVRSLVSPGDPVVISGWEHNAVVRPLAALGARVRVARGPLFSPRETLEAFDNLLEGAKCAVCTHVSNVFGYILPIYEISALCARRGVPLIVDASQSAGVLPLDVDALGAEFVAMPGHKGLLGPQGTGVLFCKNSAEPVFYGGTGSDSRIPEMPQYLPDRLEAGTHNIPGVAGLCAGVQWLKSIPRGALIRHERALARRFAHRVSSLPGIRIFLSEDPEIQSGVLSLTGDGLDCEKLAARMGQAGICLRAGLHCAPLAHESAGTLDSGTARFSFSPFNTESEVDKAAEILKKIWNRP